MSLDPKAELFEGQKAGKPVPMVKIPVPSMSDAKGNHVTRIATEDEISEISDLEARKAERDGPNVSRETLSEQDQEGE